MNSLWRLHVQWLALGFTLLVCGDESYVQRAVVNVTDANQFMFAVRNTGPESEYLIRLTPGSLIDLSDPGIKMPSLNRSALRDRPSFVTIEGGSSDGNSGAITVLDLGFRSNATVGRAAPYVLMTGPACSHAPCTVWGCHACSAPQHLAIAGESVHDLHQARLEESGCARLMRLVSCATHPVVDHV
jgi:hypothetical protein